MNGFIIQYFPDGGIAIVNAGNAEAPSAFFGVMLILLLAVPAWRAYADFRRRWAQGGRAARLNLLATLGAFCLAISIHGSGKQSATNLMFGGSAQNTVTNTVSSGTTGQSSQSGASSSSAASSVPDPAQMRQLVTPPNYVIGDLPAWWTNTYPSHTNLCENGCGIPEFWHSLTRFDHAVYDCQTADRDGDGLDEWTEWWLGTDPRSESTMGHYPDGWAVANDIDPLDEALAWQDLSGDGLTTLEAYNYGKAPRDPTPIPPIILPGDGVNPITFALDAQIPPGSVAVFALAGQPRPLTASSHSVTVLFPPGATFPFSFDPPAGMDSVGLNLWGDLRRLYVNDPSGVFGAPTSKQGGMMIMGGGPPGGSGDLTDGPSFGIAPGHTIFSCAGGSVTLSVTGLLFSVPADDITWTRTGDGTFNTNKGYSVTFSSASSATVYANLATRGGSVSSSNALVTLDHAFTLPSVTIESATAHMSPALGDTLAVTAEFAPGSPCPCGAVGQGAYTASIRAGVEPMHSFLIVTTLVSQAVSGTTTLSASWDGRLGSPGNAWHPDVFTNDANGQTFNRVLPSSNDVMPPPFFHVTAGISSSFRAAADTRKVFVPQVVKVVVDPAVTNRLMASIKYTNEWTGAVTTLYDGCSEQQADQVLANLHNSIKGKFPAGANIVFVDGDTDATGAHEIHITQTDTNYPLTHMGFAPLNERNALRSQTGKVLVGNMRHSIWEKCGEFINNPNPPDEHECQNITFPIPLEKFANFIINVAAHETGHMLGLVSNDLGGSDGHNPNIMDDHDMMAPLTRLNMEMGFLKDKKAFSPMQIEYLLWLLPKQ